MKQYIIAISIILLLASCSSDKKENVVETKPATVNYPLATVEKGGVATVIKLIADSNFYFRNNIG